MLLIFVPYLQLIIFQKSQGFDTTVMVRSILLRGFDQQIANKIGDYMENHGINFIRECVPTKLEKVRCIVLL